MACNVKISHGALGLPGEDDLPLKHYAPASYSPRGPWGLNHMCPCKRSSNCIKLRVVLLAPLLIGRTTTHRAWCVTVPKITFRGRRVRPRVGLIIVLGIGMAARHGLLQLPPPNFCLYRAGLQQVLRPNRTCDPLPNALEWGGARSRCRGPPAKRYEAMLCKAGMQLPVTVEQPTVLQCDGKATAALGR